MHFYKLFTRDVLRRSTRLAAVLGTTVVLGVNTYTAVFPSFFKEYYEIPLTPAPRCHRLLDQVCNRMDIDPNHVQLVHTRKHVPRSSGCFSLFNRTRLGLPGNCSVGSLDELHRSPVMKDSSGKHSVDWETPLGKLVEETALISDCQIKYMIARELIRLRDNDFLLLTAHALGFCIGGYAAGTLSTLFTKTIGRTFLTLTITYIVVAILFTGTRTDLRHMLEYKNDTKAARLGDEYVEGGVDYFKTEVQRNRLMHHLQIDRNERRLAQLKEENEKRLAKMRERSERRLARMKGKNEQRYEEMKREEEQRLAQMEEHEKKVLEKMYSSSKDGSNSSFSLDNWYVDKLYFTEDGEDLRPAAYALVPPLHDRLKRLEKLKECGVIEDIELQDLVMQRINTFVR